MRARRIGAGLAVAAILMTACAGNDPPSTDDTTPAPSPQAPTEAAAEPTSTPAPADEIAMPDDDGLDIRYADSFESDATGWMVGKSTKDGVTVDLAYRRGAYEMNLEVPKSVKRGAAYRSFAPDDTHLWTTVDVTVDARKAGDPGPMGLLCFEQVDTVGGYEFLLDGDGMVAIVKRAGRRQIPLAEDVIADVVRPRGGNTLRIQCFSQDGNVHLRLFVNGQEMMRTVDAEEPLYRRGATGIVLATGAGGTVAAAFDDFVVRGKR